MRIEPTPTMPGLRASVLTEPDAAAALGDRPRRQLGSTGALVVRDGVAGAAAGPPVDVLPAHRGLAAGPVTVVAPVVS